MSDYVWVSSMNEDSLLTKYVSTNAAKVSPQDGLRIAWYGVPAPADYGPTKVWADKIPTDANAMKPKYTPEPVFNADGFWLVCAEAAEILRKFDLGGGTLNHVKDGVWAPDPNVRDPRDWFCWTIGNAKRAFLEASSPLAPGRDGPQHRYVCNLPFSNKMDDDLIAVSSDAVQGADAWMDKGLARAVFMSRGLGDALNVGGLRKAFRLYRARVV